MGDRTNRRAYERPLDYYLAPEPVQRSSFPQWQPSANPVPAIAVTQAPPAPGEFKSAADMYRHNSYGYTAPQQPQPHPYSYEYPSHHQAPPFGQGPGRQPSLTSFLPPANAPPSRPSTATTTHDSKSSRTVHRHHSEMDIRPATHAGVAFPHADARMPVPPLRQDLHVQTTFEPPPMQAGGALQGPPPPGAAPPAQPPQSPPVRARTNSQPNKPHLPGARRPTQTQPPVPPLPDPYSIANPSTRQGARYPNPNDPFTVTSPLKLPLKQIKSNSTDSGHKGYIHACMSLNRTDRIRLIKFPPTVVTSVRKAIEGSWPRGIQSEKDISGACEFQLKGNPWTGQGDEAVPARILMCEVLSAIYHNGWQLCMSTDISQKAMDKDLLIFREEALPPPCQFLAISFNDNDRLRVIRGGGGSTTSVAPNDVINAIKNVWGGNIQKEQWKVEGIAWEFKLAGHPWWASGSESVHVRILLLNMLDQLTMLGWDFHASLDMTAGPGGPTKNAGSDTDCWIFKKPY